MEKMFSPTTREVAVMELIASLHPAAQVTAIIMMGVVAIAFIIFVIGRAI